MPDARVTSVYQYFDGRGQLLYVGVTVRGLRRAVEHAESKEWWSLAATCVFEHYDSRSLALRREELLIRRYCPPFNTVHNPRKAESLRALKLSDPLVHSDVVESVADQVPVIQRAVSERATDEYESAVERVLAAGVPLADRRRAWYGLSKRVKRLVPCIHCGMRPGDRGPECRSCLRAAQADRAVSDSRQKEAV